MIPFFTNKRVFFFLDQNLFSVPIDEILTVYAEAQYIQGTTPNSSREIWYLCAKLNNGTEHRVYNQVPESAQRIEAEFRKIKTGESGQV
jgi:hypothetical protein